MQVWVVLLALYGKLYKADPDPDPDPGHLEKADPVPKIIFDKFEGADFKYDNTFLKF